MRGKFDSVVWYELVNVTVLVALRLRMANQYNHLHMGVSGLALQSIESATARTRGLPMLEA